MTPKTIAMILLAAVAVGTIGIGTTEHAFAQFRRGPGQNDNNKGNNNNQGAGLCFGKILTHGRIRGFEQVNKSQFTKIRSSLGKLLLQRLESQKSVEIHFGT